MLGLAVGDGCWWHVIRYNELHFVLLWIFVVNICLLIQPISSNIAVLCLKMRFLTPFNISKSNGTVFVSPISLNTHASILVNQSTCLCSSNVGFT